MTYKTLHKHFIFPNKIDKTIYLLKKALKGILLSLVFLSKLCKVDKEKGLNKKTIITNKIKKLRQKNPKCKASKDSNIRNHFNLYFPI